VSLTVIVTRAVEDRFRGFLGSCMIEVSPGVYTAVRMRASVRERVWEVLADWHKGLASEGSVVMTWRDLKAPGGQGLRHLGEPPRQIVEADGMALVRRE
jgi:CRISPR-associated protein Cas2